jgi:NAD(P)-dependent dehydrogenase (short-subunit alcohol dehydrogenase family)
MGEEKDGISTPGVAVVTAGGAGIGAATAAALTAAGWKVVAVDIDAKGLEELASGGSCAATVVGDVASDEVLVEARRTAEGLGRLAGWVNNAGINQRRRIDLVEPDVVRRIVDVDLMATFRGSQLAIQSFLDNGTAGSIVNVSSVHGRFAFPGCAVYDMCKGGVEALTRYLAVEYGPLGIRANAVAPGAVRTASVEAFIAGSPDPARTQWESENLAPLGRMAEPTEVGELIAFLMGPGASAISGQVIGVDGGSSARCYRYEPDSNLLARYGPVFERTSTVPDR